MGLCIECSNLVLGGFILCAKHLVTAAARSRKVQEQRREEGKCIRCGAPLMTEEQGVECVNCSTKDGRRRI